MTGIIQKLSFPEPPFDEREILRYAGVRDDGKDIKGLLCKCLDEVQGMCTFNVCYRIQDVCVSENTCNFGAFSVKSKSLSEHLKKSTRAVIFAATVGLDLDRLILKYSKTAPSLALMLQAIGAERIEALCDMFCNKLSEDYHITSRFSPGYGDLPIEMQKEIFALLDCPKQIGLTLNDSMLMSPTKSVTAIVGISPKE